MGPLESLALFSVICGLNRKITISSSGTCCAHLNGHGNYNYSCCQVVEDGCHCRAELMNELVTMAWHGRQNDRTNSERSAWSWCGTMENDLTKQQRIITT